VKLAVFDLDGTLTVSNRLDARCFTAALQEVGAGPISTDWSTYREQTDSGIARECLERETDSVATELGAVRVKVARRHGEVLTVSPEFDDCLRLAVESGRPVKDVQALATAAFLAR